MVYYNQNNYPHIPYPSEKNATANIKNAGCGVCCCCMVVENMTEHRLSIEECTEISMQNGGRVIRGTNMKILGPIIAERYGLTMEQTDDPERVLEFLNAKQGMVIANPSGDREGHKGTFSHGGHFIVVAEARGRTVRVLDPNYTEEEFVQEGRMAKVFAVGNDIYCDIDVVTVDCLERQPKFYLFAKKD